MKNSIRIIVISLCFAFCCAASDVEHSKESINVQGGSSLDNVSAKNFVATDEWQEIDPNQPVPAGLHYRMNMATGKVEAKLLNSNDVQSPNANSLVPVPVNGQDTVEHKPTDSVITDNNHEDVLNKSKARLQAAFQNFKLSQESPDADTPSKKQSEKFRSIEELRKHLGDLKLTMSSETETISKLLREYETADLERKLTILVDLEYYLHQIDVAKDFIRLNGIELLSKDLTVNEIRELQGKVSQALSAGGSSNTIFQSEMIRSGVFDLLLNLIAQHALTQLDANVLHVLHLIFTSARRFPVAQRKIAESGLLIRLTAIYSIQSKMSTKLQMKLIDFLYDIRMEHKDSEEQLESALRNLVEQKSDDKALTAARNRFNEFKAVGLGDQIVRSDLCDLVPDTLPKQSFDNKERILRWMNAFIADCDSKFNSKFAYLQQLGHELRLMRNKDEESDDLTHYYRTLLELVDQLLEQIQLVRTSEQKP